MKSLRKILSVMVLLVVTLSISACSANPTEEAKQSVDKYFAAAKELNIAEINKYVTEDIDVAEAEAELASLDGDEEMLIELVKKVLQETNLTYKAGEIEKGAKEGILTYTYKGMDPEDFTAKMLAYIFSNISMEDMYSEDFSYDNMNFDDFDFTEVKTMEKDIDFKMIYDETDKIWKLDNADSAFDNIYEDFDF